MSNIQVKIIDGPDFVMTNLVTDELLGKLFDVANEWMLNEILAINDQDRQQRIVGVRLSYHRIPDRVMAMDDPVVYLKIAIASSKDSRPKNDPARAAYECELDHRLKEHGRPHKT